jgi:conjugative transfer signal peptidase TraF
MMVWLRSLVPGLGAAMLHAVIGFAAPLHYAVNVSPSLPLGVYRVVPPGRLALGDIVLVCLAGDAAALARARGYLARGRCVAGVEPLGKRIGAMVGDAIAVTPQGVMVNGIPIPFTTPLRADSRGRPLPQLAGYRRTLGQGELWLIATAHRPSFDSRYFGPVSIGDVIAVGCPVWTL